MRLSDEIINDFCVCPYKAHLKLKETPFERTPFERFLIGRVNSLKTQNSTLATLITKKQFKEQNLDEGIYSIDLSYIYQDILIFEFRNNQLIPYHFGAYEINRSVLQASLTLKASFLKKELGCKSNIGKVIFERNEQIQKLHFGDISQSPSKEELESIFLQNPPFCLNKNCKWCCYQLRCKEKAVKEDHLSLLTSINPKKIGEFHEKGIFSLKQLSYQFKPRKTRKDAVNPGLKHIPALKALAIRKETIFVYKKEFNLSEQFPRIYFDIEGYLNDPKKAYLLGVIIEKGSSFIKKSFWVPNVHNKKCKVVYNDFIDHLMYYCPSGAILFHYGKFDLRFLNSLVQGIKLIERRKYVQQLIDNAFDVLEVFLKKVYLPTYSNDLKTIANYLGFDWA